MKILKYNLCTKVNHGTEEEPKIEKIISAAAIECPTQAVYDANLPIAEKEAIPGTLDLDPLGEFDPEPDTASTDDVLNALLGVEV